MTLGELLRRDPQRLEAVLAGLPESYRRSLRLLFDAATPLPLSIVEVYVLLKSLEVDPAVVSITTLTEVGLPPESDGDSSGGEPSQE
jgi:hypothetical protein